MDAVQKANAGHPGTAMALAPLAYLLYTEVMEHNPANPHWPDRDRFVLSAGPRARPPVRPAGRPRGDPPVRHAPPVRLQPLARGVEAVPAVELAHARPPGGAPHP